MFSGCLWLQLNDALDFALKDEEFFMVEIDSTALQERHHLYEVTRASIDSVFDGIAFVSVPSDDEDALECRSVTVFRRSCTSV